MKKPSKKLMFLLPLLIMGLFLSGCRTQPIFNVKNQAVSTAAPAHMKLSTMQVRQAITQAAVSRGWKVKNVSTNMIIATLDLRGHTAVVSIPYSSKSYSILYKSSDKLLHKGDMIHRSYNGWVKNLRDGINKNLSKERR